MRQDSRVVVGYHGTRRDRAETIISKGRFIVSENDYDWLGHGIYFWEHAPIRAWQWARQRYGPEGVVIEARIHLGYCLDLSDMRFTDALKAAYDGIREAYIAANKPLPVNRGKAHCLDCLVINYLTKVILPECDTVRAPFLEGEPIFNGSNFLSQSHLQLVVKDDSCIESDIRLLDEEDE